VWTVSASLLATPPTPLIPLPLSSTVSRAHRFAPTTVHTILVGKPEGKIPLGRPRHSQEDKNESLETGWEGNDWINLAQDKDRWLALVDTGIKLRVP
jgi:hypothetical protein